MSKKLTMKVPLNLEDFTKLPVRHIDVVDQALPNITVETPHKGVVSINLKEKHYPFIFGSVTQTDKSAGHIMDEIMALEEESKDYLLNKWLEEK